MKTETWGIYLYPMLDDSKAVCVGTVEADIRAEGVAWNEAEIGLAVAKLAPLFFDADQPIKHTAASGGLHKGCVDGEDYDLRAWHFDPSTKMKNSKRFSHGRDDSDRYPGSVEYESDYENQTRGEG